jgi:hypothetical protein
MLGENQLIRELKLGGVNHEEMGKKLYTPESTDHGETFLPQRKWIPSKTFL